MLELARESDWEDVKRLSVQIHDLHAKWRPDIYFSCEQPYPKDKFLEDIRDRLVYVGKLDNRIVGYVVLSVNIKSGPGTHEKKLLRLDVICVDESRRGQGIGMSMVDDVRALAKVFRCDGILLGVHPENEDALRFYLKCGFSLRTVNLEMCF